MVSIVQQQEWRDVELELPADGQLVEFEWYSGKVYRGYYVRGVWGVDGQGIHVLAGVRRWRPVAQGRGD